jgi:hypothetical protein
MEKLCPFYWTLLKTDSDGISNTRSTRDRSEIFLLFSLSVFFLSFFLSLFSTLFSLFLWWMVEVGSGWDDGAAATVTNVN